jgi:hypothetical protein
MVHHQHQVMFHECVRGTSWALILVCVRPSCVARCWSMVRIRVRAYYAACNSSWGLFCHKYDTCNHCDLLGASFVIIAALMNLLGASFFIIVSLHLKSRCKVFVMLHFWLHHAPHCRIFGYSCIHALSHSKRHIAV